MIFDQIHRYDRKGYALSGSSKYGEVEDKAELQGIVPDHSYTILQVSIVQVDGDD
jgi:hypothetical protein